MKNFSLALLIITLLSFYCRAQIIPVENHQSYGEIPDGAYVKDVNNIFDKFIGVWEGEYSNKTFELNVVKQTKTFDHSQFDLLQIRYKIFDPNGTVEVDTTSPSIESYYVIDGKYIQDDGTNECYVLRYKGLGCGQGGSLYIIVKNENTNQMILTLISEGRTPFLGCPNGVEQEVFPVTQDFMILNKQ